MPHVNLCASCAPCTVLELTVYGYVRVSTLEQNTATQLAAFKRAGIDVVEEKCSALKHRPELDALLLLLKPGDVLVVYKLDRLARSVSHFVKVFEVLNSKGVGFRSLTESIETDTPQCLAFWLVHPRCFG